MPTSRLTGLVAAVHSPFDSSGDLNLGVVERQLEWLLSQGVTKVFVCGSTGESQSLTVVERHALAARWFELSRGTAMEIVVHVGSNCLSDARALASQAGKAQARAVAATAPSFFKPKNVAVLLEWCREIAAAAPETPFYFYDIPILTGVNLSMPELLEAADDSIPNFAGLKFTNQDLYSFQRCLRVRGGKFDIAFGFDEMLLAALAVGAVGAVGSTYNFSATIHHRIIEAFGKGDMQRARDEQFKSVETIRTLTEHGFLAATKAVMEILGIPVGRARAPQDSFDAAAIRELRSDLERLGFFEWIGVSL